MNRFFTAALVKKRTTLGEQEKGFTLIELLVVVLILGVLAAISIPIYLGQQDAAKDQAVATSITNAKTAVVTEIVTSDTTVADLVGNPLVVPGYTDSADVIVSLVANGTTGFTITGTWGATTTHTYTITDTGTAVKSS